MRGNLEVVFDKHSSTCIYVVCSAAMRAGFKGIVIYQPRSRGLMSRSMH
jgi:hypothetical protein